MRRVLPSAAALLVGLVLAAPAAAGEWRIVGGTATARGEYPSIARVVTGTLAGCTGTLVAPTWVLTAGHCASSGAVGLGTPVGLPGPAFDVAIGGTAADGSDGEPATVLRAVLPVEYTLTVGYDVALLELLEAPAAAPVPVAGRGYSPLWAPNAMTEIVGFGTSSAEGPVAASLQRADVPIVADPSCAAAYPDSFEAVTQVCAGYAAGGVDACQGDSGGPAYGRSSAGERLVVATSSYGDGCGKAGRPGVYARVADAELREWIRGIAPEAVRDAPPGAVTSPKWVYDPATGTTSSGAPTSSGPPGAGSGSSPPSSATVPGTASTPALRIALGVDPIVRRTLARRGLRYRLRCSGPCVAEVLLRIDRATARRLGLPSAVVGRSRLTRDSAGRSLQQVRIFSAKLRKRLGGLRSVKLTLVASVGPRGSSMRTTIARRVRLK